MFIPEFQLVLEEFKLGRFQSPHHRGCPDGHLQVYGGFGGGGGGGAARKRSGGGGSGSSSSSSSSSALSSVVGGQYCGRLPRGAPRPVVRSGEAAVAAGGGGDGGGGGGGGGRLVANVRFFQFSGDDPEDDFSLRLRYKFLPRRKRAAAPAAAAERRGSGGGSGGGGGGGGGFHYGVPLPGTACSRLLNDCVHRACRIRSPGYPGLYPRNATCRYRVHVRRADTPRGMRPLVVIKQVLFLWGMGGWVPYPTVYSHLKEE